MNKPEQNLGSAGDGMSPEKITEIMADPAFTAEQLPGLWQQIAGDDGAVATLDSMHHWCNGIETVFRRCDTYPQHAELAMTLSQMESAAWRFADWATDHCRDLFREAASEQLRQALTFEQQCPEGGWPVATDILAWATPEQLTGPVIAQFRWRSEFLGYTAAPVSWSLEDDFEHARTCRVSRIVEHVRQRLLDGDESAWTVFLGIAEGGVSIGEAAALANAIERQDSPHPTSQ